jgi:hypothetical protein
LWLQVHRLSLGFVGGFVKETDLTVVYPSMTDVNLTGLGVAYLGDLCWIERRLFEILIPVPPLTQAIETWTPMKLMEEITNRTQYRRLSFGEANNCGHFFEVTLLSPKP